MTEITNASATKTGALSTLRLAELQQLAGSMGIRVDTKMRKADLVSAIRERQGGAASARSRQTNDQQAPQSDKAADNGGNAASTNPGAASLEAALDRAQAEREATLQKSGGDQGSNDTSQDSGDSSPSRTRRSRRGGSREGGGSPNDSGGGSQQQTDHEDTQQGNDRSQQGEQRTDSRHHDGRQQSSRPGDQRNDDEGGGRGRRRSRSRSRNKKGSGGSSHSQSGNSSGGNTQPSESYSDEDVLVPVAGVLDLLDNYAFIRTSGFLPGPDDIYVPMNMVKKHGLRKGDAVTGAIKAPTEGRDHQHTVSSTGNKRDKGKFSALVRLDTVNGLPSDDARKRPEFGRLTPLYPQERLRLETDSKNLTTRIIDLVAPIGKGQRGLIVSPAKAGKTMVMQSMANAIVENNPEVHLMIVLVDERPEEVTDFERSTKGEVISSTFDRPAGDHTMVAELAIERAKRLVEMGQDVVVLLDGITRLGRAYNLAAPASGRILSGGVDSAALYPPKKFFGAARNIEDGGSLTILATALIESGSKMDEVIFEEFKGTGNMELRLSRQLADRRTFPAVDVNSSGTRREEILMGNEELKIMWKLRRVLSALDQQQGIELLIDRLKKTRNNYEFLSQVQQTSSVKLDTDDE